MRLAVAVLAGAFLFQGAPGPAQLPALVGTWTTTEPEPPRPYARMVPPALTISMKDGKTYVALGNAAPEEVRVLAPVRDAGPSDVSVLDLQRPPDRWQIRLRPVGAGTLRLEMYSGVGATGRYWEETFKKAR